MKAHGEGVNGIHYCPACRAYSEEPTVHIHKNGERVNSIPVTNAGTLCDSIEGPCSCGATHHMRNGKRF